VEWACIRRGRRLILLSLPVDESVIHETSESLVIRQARSGDKQQFKVLVVGEEGMETDLSMTD
jgi:hypothetical protein